MKRRAVIAVELAAAGSTLISGRTLAADVAPIGITEMGRGENPPGSPDLFWRRAQRFYHGHA